MTLPTSQATTLLGPDDWEEAIADTAGLQLVLAGPGTGKTEFLARRAAHLLQTGVPGSDILILSFSRRSAAALDARIAHRLDRPLGGAGATTFHSFAHRLLEEHHFSEGRSVPILLTGPEQVRFVSRLLAQEEPTEWPLTFRPLLTSSTLAAEVADFVMRCHERLIDPLRLGEMARERADWRALPAFLDRYRAALREAGKIDYGLLVAEAVEILSSTDPGFSHVIVDEYQDTSPAQARLARLAARSGNLTVAGDPNQSIYSFRGAEPGNVQDFRHEVSEARGRVYVLGRSFRVPAAILASAHRLVAANPPSFGPAPVPADHDGGVEVYTFDQRSAEAEWIAGEVERLWHSEGLPLTSIAVLVRSTRHLLPELSRALDRRAIPHDRPDVRLVDHPAIRLFHDTVVAATSPEGTPDRDLALRRLLLGPAVGMSLAAERELTRTRRRRGLAWPAALGDAPVDTAGLAELLEDTSWATEMPAVDGFWHAWDRMPGLEGLVNDPTRADYRRAWHSFSRMLERQTERDPTISLAESLEASLSGDFEAAPLLRISRSEGLVVTTLHQAKGLEFEVVFVADAVDGVFPDTRRVARLLQPQLLSGHGLTDGATRARLHLEEERRLAYTATTRARRRVVWTATLAGIDEGERRPSRFMLAAAGLDSFEEVTSPPPNDDRLFDPLTVSAAEAQLRRLLLDPAAPEAARLAALRTLTAYPAWDPSGYAGVPDPGPDTGVLDGPIRLSPSQATSYDQCPRRYVLERRLRAIEVDSPYLRFGSIVHEVLEETELEAVESGRSHGDIETALRHLEAVWERHPPFGPPAYDQAWYRRAATLLVGMYADWPGRQGTPVAVEAPLDMELGGVQWVGRADRIDRVDAGLRIVDYKTSKSPPTLKEAARSLQLGYYLLAAAASPEMTAHGRPVAAELWYPLAERRKIFPFEMENLDEVRQTLEEVATGILEEDWTPRVGAHCERCQFRDVCPAWPDGREAYR